MDGGHSLMGVVDMLEDLWTKAIEDTLHINKKKFKVRINTSWGPQYPKWLSLTFMHCWQFVFCVCFIRVVDLYELLSGFMVVLAIYFVRILASFCWYLISLIDHTWRKWWMYSYSVWDLLELLYIRYCEWITLIKHSTISILSNRTVNVLLCFLGICLCNIWCRVE